MKASLYLFYLIIVAISFCPTAIVSAQNSCTSDPYYSKLDFWLGAWDVYDASGKLVGSNVIQKVLNGCAVEEKWTDSDGGEGQSLFYVDNNDSTWHQIWVTENSKIAGGQKHKKLVDDGRDNEPIMFQGYYYYNGKKIEDRTTLTQRSEGTVVQVIERSFDEGKTWKKGFFGVYKKKK